MRLRDRLVRTCTIFSLVFSAALWAADGAAARTVDALLRELEAQGVDVIYSSDLVPAGLAAPEGLQGTPLQRARAALASHGLALRELAPDRYVVVRPDPPPAAPSPPDEPLQEISVYASRYAIAARDVGEPREMSTTDIEMVPGSHDDALRALRSLPGLATNISGRPYIRGSLSEDVLVRYDNVTLLDPFHLKNFQSLISAIDPATIERVEVFSGGFPVRYGTRSGGVIAIDAPSRVAGYENRAAASLISAGVSSTGRSERWPVEWTAAIRRSTLDLLDPIEDDFGRPQFSDSLGRLRWNRDDGAWTLGWLLLDDRIELGNQGDEEIANATYRDEYLWLARDLEFGPSLRTRATAVLTNSHRHRDGILDNPGVANGSLAETSDFERIEFDNVWTLDRGPRVTYTFGGEAAVSHAEYDYSRNSLYDPAVAVAFGRDVANDLTTALRPRVFTYALHAARRQKWERFEAEVGVRLDGQHYNLGGDHTQFSPRLNLRYDASDRLRLYASAGRFTQAQHVEEWRIEEAQPAADSAQVAVHTIVGLTYETPGATQLGIELYTKRWTTTAPYFDSRLGPLSLLPDLGPDRIRVEPAKSESSGLEFSVRKPFTARVTGWTTLSWSRVADDIGDGDVLRSWDQPLAATFGLGWRGSRASISALAGWHRGWPRTPLAIVSSPGEPDALLVGNRNDERWRDYYTFDLRGSWTWPHSTGDFKIVLEATNATNLDNECCSAISRGADGRLQVDTDHWLPAIVNIGFSYSWGKSD